MGRIRNQPRMNTDRHGWDDANQLGGIAVGETREEPPILFLIRVRSVFHQWFQEFPRQGAKRSLTIDLAGRSRGPSTLRWLGPREIMPSGSTPITFSRPTGAGELAGVAGQIAGRGRGRGQGRPPADPTGEPMCCGRIDPFVLRSLPNVPGTRRQWRGGPIQWRLQAGRAVPGAARRIRRAHDPLRLPLLDLPGRRPAQLVEPAPRLPSRPAGRACGSRRQDRNQVQS